MPQIAGGCLCGKVRYSASGDPAFVGVCHCTDCQKATGSAFGVVIGLPAPGVSVQGTITTFRKTADSGKSIERNFCPACGSIVSEAGEAMPGIVMIPVGTLDDTSWVKPAMQIFCDSAQSWVHLGGELKAFPKMPG